jgi:hypothetical protein
LTTLQNIDFGIQIGKIDGVEYVVQCVAGENKMLLKNSDVLQNNVLNKMLFELAPRKDGELLCDSQFGSIL